jgi:hypothetical protein
MKDPIAGLRRKSKFIAEIRYPAAPRLFDIKGKIIDAIHPQISDRFPHWQVETGSVRFADTLDKTPREEFTIALKRTAVQLEDSGTVQEFADRTRRYLALMHEHLGKAVTRVSRCGVRLLAIYSPAGGTSFEDVTSRVLHRFAIMPPDISLTAKDAMVRIVHSRGFYYVGPAKLGERWVKQVFSDPERNVPEAGLGVDIDSFETDLAVATAQQLQQVFSAVLRLTKSIEESLIRHAGFLDESLGRQ